MRNPPSGEIRGFVTAGDNDDGNTPVLFMMRLERSGGILVTLLISQPGTILIRS